jgi:hypothetical protein
VAGDAAGHAIVARLQAAVQAACWPRSGGLEVFMRRDMPRNQAMPAEPAAPPPAASCCTRASM